MIAEFGTTQVFWSLFWFFLFVLWWSLIIMVLREVFRLEQLSGLAKALWMIGIILFPVIGIIVFMAVHGSATGGAADGRPGTRLVDTRRPDITRTVPRVY